MTAKYSGQEIEAVFSANAEQADYGVPGSPQWWEPVDRELDSLTILGVDVSLDSLPEKLQKELLSLADDLEFELDA